jgi:hypothetical protein
MSFILPVQVHVTQRHATTFHSCCRFVVPSCMSIVGDASQKDCDYLTCFLALKLYLPPLHLSPPSSPSSRPPTASMATSLNPRFWSNSDLGWVRRLLGWQATEYDGRIRCGTVSLTDLQRGEIVLFASYVLAGLALPASSFLTLLENYGLQLHHLTLHAIALVSISVHLCEMYVGVWPSVHLFRLLFTPRASGWSQTHLGAYYFQGRSKSSATYITPSARQMGPLEGGLGDCTDRFPQPAAVANRCPDR